MLCLSLVVMRCQPLRRALASCSKNQKNLESNILEQSASCFESSRISLCVSVGYLRGRKR
ncbi:hypothetical protein LQQ02_11725 [Vibrio cholerae]|nr:hypothetical protein [Vibrio cholerae]MCE3054786.1 hypothetical protein [Vibrio cholerae]